VISGEDYSISGKTFEYITNLKPIISFSCSGAQDRLISNTGLGLHFDPDKTKESCDKFVEILNQGIHLKPNSKFIQSLHTSIKTKELKDLIEAQL
jgi:hypothetical protein